MLQNMSRGQQVSGFVAALLLVVAACGAPRLFNGLGDEDRATEQAGGGGEGSGGADVGAATSDRLPVNTEPPLATATRASSVAEATDAPAPRPTDDAASDVDAPAAGATPSRPPEAAPPPPAEPEADLSRHLGQKVSGGSGGIFDLVDLRSGEHDGLTRVVWELAAREDLKPGDAPNFSAVEQSNQNAPETVGARLEGPARIELVLQDVYGYDFLGTMSLDTPSSSVMRGLRLLKVEDDAMLAFAVDLNRPARYSITTLDDPPRIVLDIYQD